MSEDGLFDEAIGAYDGAEICELVARKVIPAREKVSKKYDKNNIGFYCNNGLSVFESKSVVHHWEE